MVALREPHADWSQLIDPVLAAIRDDCGEATMLGVPANGTMVSLAFFPSQHVVAVSEHLGTVRPMHCSALGKAYLSALGAAALDAELGRLSYAGGTTTAAKGPIELRGRLEEARETDSRSIGARRSKESRASRRRFACRGHSSGRQVSRPIQSLHGCDDPPAWSAPRSRSVRCVNQVKMRACLCKATTDLSVDNVDNERARRRLWARLATLAASRAGVTQLAECLLPKQNVAGSNPVSRSNVLSRDICDT